jgi:hypothetical protein
MSLKQLLERRMDYAWIGAILCGIFVDKMIEMFIILIPILCIISLVNAITLIKYSDLEISFFRALIAQIITIIPLASIVAIISYLITSFFK